MRPIGARRDRAEVFLLFNERLAAALLDAGAAEVQGDAIVDPGAGRQEGKLSAHRRFGFGAEFLVDDAQAVGVEEDAPVAVTFGKVVEAGATVGGIAVELPAAQLRIRAPVVLIEGKGFIGLDHGAPGLIATRGATAAGEARRLIKER